MNIVDSAGSTGNLQPVNRATAKASIFSFYNVIGNGILTAEYTLDGVWDIAQLSASDPAFWSVTGGACVACFNVNNNFSSTQGAGDGFQFGSLGSSGLTASLGVPNPTGSISLSFTVAAQVFDGDQGIFRFSLGSSISDGIGSVDFSNSASVRFFTSAGLSVAFDDPQFGATAGGPTAPVPLPAALPLFGTGLAALGFIGWRRKWKTAA